MKKKVLPILALFPCMILFGMIVGGVIVARFMDRSPDGWTQIADFLGGVMLGGFVGLVLSVVLAFVVSPRGMLKTAAAAALGFVLVFAWARWTQPKREIDHRDSTPSVAKPTPQPTQGTEPAISAPPESSPTAAVEPLAAASTSLPCEPAADREAFAFSGSLRAGEGYRATFGPGWEVALEPLATDPGGAGRGWEIRVLDPSSTAPPDARSSRPEAERDLARWTPPLRGPSPRRIEASHFVVDGQPKDGRVNAPQRQRFFLFSPEVGRTIGVNGNPPTAEEVERISAFGRGGLVLTEMDWADSGESGGFRRIAFDGCITWPRGFGS
ncbi:MAG: hypothetical protein AAF481_11550 [Acidobacteriota bacterium]